ncbi:glycosyltransferase family 1 protein [Gemmatimonas sp.]|uniref:glycosyltransferase family 4 protein n=1 Tax=Gemmatimonas sp. TaxID=1962908 RepID=UPI0022BD6827|nr:glycosyltransferase family 1 protein [Gemmatimonas sp.]MCZ8205198.1 glycosyltransferase family 1 protein [Gemmatimonas sp.]
MMSATFPLRHLAVEATRLLQERRGIARYVRNLLREFALQRPSLQLTLFVKDRRDVAALRLLLASVHPTLASNATIDCIDALPTTAAEVAWYPWNFITTPAQAATMVATVHDIAPMLQHDHRWWKLLKRVKYRARYRRTVQLAHAIVTDSCFSRDELVHHLRADPASITVALLAADDVPLRGSDDAQPLEAAGVGAPFMLTVGGQDARKNLVMLYEAMGMLWARGVRVPLVQCGPALARETRARLGKAPWLHHVGYVSDDQLATLYRRCTALVFPSRYEGFGLPVAEAMRAGAAVICTRESSLPEVAGSAARYVAWNDAAAMADAMQELTLHEGARHTLQEAGRRQAARLSWAATARETLQAFDRAMVRRQGAVMSSALAAPGPSAPLAASAVKGAASPLHGARDAGTAAAARCAVAPVHPPDRVFTHALLRPVASGRGRLQHETDGIAQPRHPRGGQRMRRGVRVNLRLPAGFARIDVAHAGHEPLIEKDRLDGPTP